MNISSINNDSSLNFTSRNKLIRNLGDVTMLVKREFPVISNTMLESKQNMSSTTQRLHKYSSDLIYEMRSFSKQSPNPTIGLLKMLSTMKSFKVGNCGELSLASYIACKMNGFKDVKSMFLCAYNKKTQKIRNLDHTIVTVGMKRPSKLKVKNLDMDIYTPSRDAVIVDAWLGKVDYEPNMLFEYNHNKQLGGLKPDEMFCFVLGRGDKSVSPKDMIYIEHQYPGLLKKKKPGLFHRIRYKLMSKENYEIEHISQSVKEAHRKNNNLKNAMSQEELSALIEEEMNVKNLEPKKKKNFFQRFWSEVEEASQKKDELY